MQEIIKITKQLIGSDAVNSVNAREVWEFLESGQEFAHWIKNRIESYQFEEGFDYIRLGRSKAERNLNIEKKIILDETSLLSDVEDKEEIIILKKGQNLPGKKTDYIISLDMAKHLAMVEGNDKGRQIRQYFIEFEKIGREQIETLQQRNEHLNEMVNLLKESEKKSNKLIWIYQNQLEAKEIDEKIDELIKKREWLRKKGFYFEKREL